MPPRNRSDRDDDPASRAGHEPSPEHGSERPPGDPEKGHLAVHAKGVYAEDFGLADPRGPGRAHERGPRPDGGVHVPVPGLGSLDVTRLLWLGGLGALVAVGVLEWPVALVVGAGSIVTERLARGGPREP